MTGADGAAERRAALVAARRAALVAARAALAGRGNLPAATRLLLRELVDTLLAAYPKMGVVPTGQWPEEELVMAYVDLYLRQRDRAVLAEQDAVALREQLRELGAAPAV